MRRTLTVFLVATVIAALMVSSACTGVWAAPKAPSKPKATSTPRPTSTPSRTPTTKPTSTPTRTTAPTNTPTSTSIPTNAPTSTNTATPVTGIPVTVNVDTQQDRAAISPYVYGSNVDLGLNSLAFRRLGGNRMTGYNWETNASNAGSDWNQSSDSFMCQALALSTAECNTPGGVITKWQDQSVALGAASLLTLQMAGYVAADMNGTVTEAETAPSSRWNAAPYQKTSAFTTSPDPADGNVYADEQVNFMVSRYGNASTPGGVKMYALDNEPDLWSSTHPRIHPTAAGAAELVDRSSLLAQAVKAVDPGAEIFGCESYGFTGYLSLQDAPDWNSVKGSYGWYIDYYLDQMRLQGESAGKRLLDVLSVHWYPEAQGGGQRIVGLGTGGVDTQKARVQAPRTLWDPTYRESSWIAQYFASYLPLIPRMQSSINAYYPGTKLAVTEYSYGGESDVSGGLANADVLGIFGKYGAHAGAFWPMESDQSYVKAAFQLYRNYDGAGGLYGNTNVRATTSNVDDSSVYAAINGSDDSTLHVIVLNKNFDSPASFNFNLAGGRTYLQGEVWAFDATTAAITQRAPISGITNNQFSYTLQPRTAAHIVLHAAGEAEYTPVPTPAPTNTPAPTTTPNASNDLIVYADALSGWENWSWNTTLNFANTSPVQSGTRSIAATYTTGWAGLSLRTATPVNTASYSGISFWVYGAPGSGQTNFYIQPTDGGSGSAPYSFTTTVGVWSVYTVTWADLGGPTQVARLNWQEVTGSAKPTFYIDNVRFLSR